MNDFSHSLIKKSHNCFVTNELVFNKLSESFSKNTFILTHVSFLNDSVFFNEFQSE